MCGILFTNIDRISTNEFKDSLKLMVHRGPDASGFFSHNSSKLGHNRLKIQDLNDRSNQPFSSHNERYFCIFNGEIYNYKKLALEHKIELKTTCDTELLVELFVMYGEKMLSMLNGMFAFLIFDNKTNNYFIARDRLGIKPLYIFNSSEGVIIASEVNAILKLIKTTVLDEVGIRQYKKLRAFHNNRTIYKNISSFPAAHYFNSKTPFKKSQIKRYWDIDFSNKSNVSDDQIEDLLYSSVKLRNLSDVAVGTYLSGGLDSSIITCLANQKHSWTVGFEDNNEFSYAQAVAEKYHTKHHEIIVDYSDFIPTLNYMISIRKEPLSVPNEVLLFIMTREVKKKNTVVLSGEGADELFYGYDKIFWWAQNNPWSVESFDKYYSYGSNNDLEIIEDVMHGYEKYNSSLEKITAFFQVDHLQSLLRRLDNSTMLNSVEARVPFVDHRIVELMAGASFKYRTSSGNQIKAPLKRIYRSKLPVEVVDRKKIGFPVPLDKIFHDKSLKPMDSWLEYNLNYLINEVLQ
jgi:asparagine synthase (glutamine-hydrolysing)